MEELDRVPYTVDFRLTNHLFRVTYKPVGMLTENEMSDLPETKRKLLDAGIHLMRSKGFNATTVDDVCSAAGVTKGAFFHYFKSKEDIAKTALQHFCDGKARDSQSAAFRKVKDPLARVYARLDFIKESVGGTARLTRGCLIGTFAQEVSFTHPELRELCRESFLRMARDFEKDLEEAKLAHAPEAAFDPKSLAILFVSIFQGSTMLAKSSDSNAILLDNIEQFRRYLQNLFGLKRQAGAKPNRNSETVSK